MRLPSAARDDPGGDYFDPAGLKLIALIWRWRTFLALNTLLVMVLAALVSLTMTNIYRTRATIFPPQAEGGGFSAKMADFLSGLGPVGFAAAGAHASSSDLLATVLRSRRLADLVVAREGLLAYYGAASLPEARRRFQDALTVTVDADGLINLRFSDRDPVRAATVVNSALALLDSVNQSLSTGAATATRRFVESRLDEVELQLRGAEDTLRAFQEARGAIALEEQVGVLIEGLALLRVERMKQEMSLAALADRLGADHRRVESTREQIATLDRQIRAAESSGDSAATLTAGNAPALVLESVRLLRQVAVYEQLYRFLRQALEQAKIDELRNLPTFTVLDPAEPPDRKWKPRRTFIVLGSGFTTLALLTLLIVLAESLQAHPQGAALSYGAGWRRLVYRRREPVNKESEIK